MAIIIKKNADSAKPPDSRDQEIWLFSDHIFGRDSRCSTILQGNAVSRFHARINWNGTEWILRDMGSRNGTFINGRLLENGTIHHLQTGDRILFGDFTEEYQLVENEAPQALLLSYDDKEKETRIPLSSLLPLPSPETPLATIFYSPNLCALETEQGDVVPLEHGKKFMVGGRTYRAILDNLPGEAPQTATSDLIHDVMDVRLDIAVAPDQESAAITIHHKKGAQIFSPKAHFYLLNYLAQIRTFQKENQSKFSFLQEDEKGWVDCDLICNDLRINKEHLAQQVFRIRQDLKLCDPWIAEQIIDRRLRGKMRIGFPAECLHIHSMS